MITTCTFWGCHYADRPPSANGQLARRYPSRYISCMPNLVSLGSYYFLGIVPTIKATGTTLTLAGIRDTWDCEHAAALFCGVDMPSQPLTCSITPRHDMLKCHKPAGNSRRLERVLTTREVRNPRKFGFAKFVSEFNAYDRYALSSAIHSLREMWITNASFNNFATSTKISSLTSGWHANFVALLQSTRLATLATQFVNSAIVGCWTDKVTRTWVQFKHKLHHKAKKNKWSK